MPVDDGSVARRGKRELGTVGSVSQLVDERNILDAAICGKGVIQAGSD